MTALAKRNYEEAKGYRDNILNEKRNAYFAQIMRE